MLRLGNLALMFLSCVVLLNSSCAIEEDEVITADMVERAGSPGVFLDSAVAGVNYLTSSGLAGVTDTNGTFYYNSGDTVSFTLGDVSLGSVTGSAKLTPVEVMGASGTADPKVINLSRLLQTLDADGDPSNGINIEASTQTALKGKAIDFDVPVESFSNATAAVTEAVGKPMISATAALKHLHSTMEDQGMDSKVASDKELQAVSSELQNFETIPAGFKISKNTASLQEIGNSETFTVVLDSGPISDVVLSVIASDAGEVAASPSSLGFGIDNWSLAQTVTIRGVDDKISDGTVSSVVIVGVDKDKTKDSAYDKLPSQNLKTTTVDNEPSPNVSMSSSVENVEENGGEITLLFTMDLAAGTDTIVTLATSGTATFGSDYKLSSNAAIIPAGSKKSTITIQSIDDRIDDENEKIIIDVKDITGGNGAKEYGEQKASLTINDDDQAGFTLSKSSALVTENGDTEAFTIVLNSRPTENVVFNINSENIKEAKVSKPTLIFTNSNWNIPQEVIITGIDDEEIDSATSSKIIVSVNQESNKDSIYVGLLTQSLTVTNKDNEPTPLVTLTTTGALVSENGESIVLTANLSTILKSDTEIKLSISGTADLDQDYSLSSSKITIPAGSTSGSIKITGIADKLAEESETILIKISGVSSNSGAIENGNQQATVNITDDDTAALKITESEDSTLVNENGSTDTFTVKLGSQPTSDVVVDLTVSDGTEAKISTSSLTFTTSDWNSAKTVTVTGVDDNIYDQSVNVTIKLAVNTSSTADLAYAKLSPQSLNLKAMDNDSAPVITLASSLTNLDENKSTVVLTATISAVSNSDTIVILEPSGSATLSTDYALSSTSITILAGKTTGTTNLESIEDYVDEDAETVVLDISGVFGGIATESGTQQVSITINDDDTSTFKINELDGSTTVEEGGSKDTFTVVLGSEPTSNVVFDLTASDSTEASVSTSSLTFNASNWNQAQTVTVSGVDDPIRDELVNSAIAVAIDKSSTNDTKYAALSSKSVSVSTSDDEGNPIVSVATSVNSMDESGGMAILTVKQDTVAVTNTTVTLNTSGTAILNSDYSLSSTSLTIPAGSREVKATLQAVSDNIDEAVEKVEVSIGSVSGGNGAKVGGNQVEVSINDDDVSGFTVAASGGSTSVSESGSSTDTISVVLKSEPIGKVTFLVEASDATEVRVSSSSLMFNTSNWNQAQTITVYGEDDLIRDGLVSSEIKVAINKQGTADSKYAVLSSQSLPVSTIDDGAVPLVSLAASASSLNEGGNQVVLTVIQNVVALADTTVTLGTSGTAVLNSDYSLSSTTLTIPAGSREMKVTLTAISDWIDEDTEEIRVAISGVSGASGASANGDQLAVITIKDDDISAFTIVETDGATKVSEGGGTLASGSVEVTGCEPVWNTGQNFFGINLSFYQQNQSLFGVGQQIIADDRTYFIDATNIPGNCNKGVALVYVAASQNSADGNPWSPAGALKSNLNGNSTWKLPSGESKDSFTITLASQPMDQVMFDVTVSDNTEASVNPSKLTFNASNWNQAQTITITGVDDPIRDELVNSEVAVAINKSSTNDAKYTVLSSKSLLVSTSDDEAAPTVTLYVAASSVLENAGSVSLTAIQNVVATQNTKVTLNISGTATLDTDYSIASNTITIPAGSKSGTAILTIANDTTVENSETVFIDIAGVSGGNGAVEEGTQKTTLTISNDDSAAVTIADVSVSENAGSATLTLRLDKAVSGGFSVDVSTSNGSASAGSDYTALSSKRVTFSGSAGEAETVSIAINNDSVVEGSETLNVRMSNVSHNGVQITDTATVTISNDDSAAVTIADVSVSENAGSATLTLRLDKAVSGGFSVDVSTSNGSASAGSDYTALSSKRVTFSGSAGEAETVSIAINNDSVVEGSETLNVRMSNVSHNGVQITDTATVTISNDDKIGITYQTWECGFWNSGGGYYGFPSWQNLWPCPTSPSVHPWNSQSFEMSQVGKVLSSGKLTSGDINFNWSSGNVLDSGRRDYIVVKLTGNFVMPGTPGTSYSVRFRNHDDDGSILKINGVEIINDWSGLHPPAHRYSGWRTLVGGQSYSYERLFSEWGGGAVLRQEWYIWGLHDWKYMNIGNDFE